ncbi:hypothetical protein PWT90_03476 [Aphanocladium album]|nr:hypothetical protein PWT90_03476 [Aphanocladium album]
MADPEELFFFTNSLQNTFYDPLYLEIAPLRQPVPRGLPPHLDASVFTFKDAFEDLLIASHGGRLPDIESRHLHSNMMRQLHPAGESHASWYRRLETQSLIHTPGLAAFARRVPMSFPALMYGGLDRGTEALRLSLHRQEKIQMDAYAERKERKLRELFGGAHADDARSPAEQQRKREPDHFDDLFSALPIAQANGSWEAFKKSLQGDGESMTAGPRDVFDIPRPGDEVSKWVDSLGYTHMSVKRKVFDKDGNELGTHQRFYISNEPEEDPNRTQNGHVGARADAKKKSGWFW